MKKIWLSVAFALFASIANAQTATANSKIGFDIPGQTPAIAATATYKGYVDGSLTGVNLSNVSCSGTTTTTCTVDFPALTVGTHTITITQGFGTSESAKSGVLNFTFVVVVTPTNVRIVGS